MTTNLIPLPSNGRDIRVVPSPKGFQVIGPDGAVVHRLPHADNPELFARELGALLRFARNSGVEHNRAAMRALLGIQEPEPIPPTPAVEPTKREPIGHRYPNRRPRNPIPQS